MNTLAPKCPFQPHSPDAAGVISWVHLGNLHMTKAEEQNHLDLAEIVNEVNRAFADCPFRTECTLVSKLPAV